MICNDKNEEDLHLVTSYSVSNKLKTYTDVTESTDISIRLNSTTDAIAGDILYHMACFRKLERKALSFMNAGATDSSDNLMDMAQTVTDIEFLHWVIHSFIDGSHTTDSNILHEKYVETLKDNRPEEVMQHNRYKFRKHIKGIIRDNLSGISFIPAPNPKDPDIVCSDKVVQFAVDAAIKSDSEMWVLHEAAKTLRRKILLKQCSWKFTGDFSPENYSCCPAEMSLFLKWIMFQNDDKMSDLRKTEVKCLVHSVGQTIAGNCKTDRQVTYKTQEGKEERGFYGKESPITVGTGLMVYAKTRSKKLIEELSATNISCSYKAIQDIENCIYDYCVQNYIDDDGVYIPATMSRHHRAFFAIDNVDFQRDTKDGKDQLHATITTMMQNVPEAVSDSNTQPNIKICRKISKDQSANSKKIPGSTNIQVCIPPKTYSTKMTNYRGTVLLAQQKFERLDQTWGLLQYQNDHSAVPTWKYFNSNIAEKTGETVQSLFYGTLILGSMGIIYKVVS